MSPDIVSILIATFGAAIQELAHWYELRNKLDTKTHQKLMRSPAYWTVTLLMIMGSGVGVHLWFMGSDVGPRILLVAGAAFPLLLKKGVAVISRPEATLGSEESALSSYFQTGSRRS